jgi:hypothetical protein
MQATYIEWIQRTNIRQLELDPKRALKQAIFGPLDSTVPAHCPWDWQVMTPAPPAGKLTGSKIIIFSLLPSLFFPFSEVS